MEENKTDMPLGEEAKGTQTVPSDNSAAPAGAAEPAEEKQDADKKEKKRDKKRDAEIEELKKSLEEQNDKYMRLYAEYENYRRRSQRERETVYADAYADALTLLLPAMDNVDRAAEFATDGSEMAKGLLLLQKQMVQTLETAGVEEIKAEGEQFDPLVHNAVMHEENDEYGENTVVQVLLKGYRRGDRILRHAMVKVAN